MTLAVTLGASVGCVSLRHDLARHCSLDKFRASKKTYNGHESTCWNKCPEATGCANGAQVSHPGMLEVLPQAEQVESVSVKRTQPDDSAMIDGFVPDEHAIPSASDRNTSALNDGISPTTKLDVSAAEQVLQGFVETSASTHAVVDAPKHDVVALPSMVPLRSDGMIEATVNASSVVGNEAAVSDPIESGIELSTPLATDERVPSVAKFSAPEVTVTEAPDSIPSALKGTVSANRSTTQPAPPQVEVPPVLEFGKVKRVAVPEPKSGVLEETVLEETELDETTPSEFTDAASDERFEPYKMKHTFAPVSVETKSSRMIPSMVTLPKRVPVIPSETTASVNVTSERDSNMNRFAPLRRIPISVEGLRVERQPVPGPQPVMGSQMVTETPIGTGLYPVPANRIQIPSGT